MTAIFRNILLLQLGDIGDIVLTTPTIRAAKETFPDAQVSIMVRKPFGSLLAADPHLYEIVESTKFRGSLFYVIKESFTFARRLRRAHYDLVIDLRTGDRGAIYSYFTGAKVRAGRPGGGNQFWHRFSFNKIIHHTKSAPIAHPGAAQSLRIVQEISINTHDSIPRLFISNNDAARATELLMECGLSSGNRWISINPFSRWKYKEWSINKWKIVIDHLWNSHQIPVVLIGSAEESTACMAITASRAGYTFNLAGRTTLGELAALISMSSLHLGVDSAAPHIAAALETPTITIHGPTDWRAWRIVDDLHSVIAPAMDCVPCNRMGCQNSGASRCLETLGVEAVISTIDDFFKNHR